MSKFAAIDTAVRLQLASDGRAIAYDRLMNAAQDPAGAAAPYDDAAMKTFLLNVANRLRLDTPSLVFAWRSLLTTECLTSRPPMLISLIETATELAG